MKRTTTIIDYTLFFLLFFLTFLVVFEQFVVVPKSLQVLGRIHPLVLHLPIGFMAALVLLPAIKQAIPKASYSHIQVFLLTLSALTLSFSAVAGFFLAQEEGYQTDLVNWHKWTAIAASYLAYGLLVLKKQFADYKKVFSIGLYFNFIVLMLVGHLGGSITHGKDYLFAPLKSSESPSITPQSTVFEAAIQPIFKAKCNKCHNPNKRKGGLSMVSQKALEKGGKNGPIWQAGQPDSSQLLQRIHLPLSAEEHMPPEGQAQLNSQEIELIQLWIKSGASYEATIASITKEEELFLALQPLLNTGSGSANASQQEYPFKAISTKNLQELNTPYRTVSPIAQGSAALTVEFFIQQAFQTTFLNELSAAKKQIVSINLSNMPLEDDGIKLLKPFPNLEKLILNGTDITGASLGELAACTKLNHIALSNTSVKATDLYPLANLPALQTIYLWETEVSEDDLTALQQKMPSVNFDLGFQASSEEMLQLSPPILANVNTILKSKEEVVLETKFPGAEIRYTTDGTDPDSVSARLFSEPFPIQDLTNIKAKTFSQGWLPSDVAEFSLFPLGYVPDSALLMTKANPQYVGEGSKSLIDKEKGNIGNFRNPVWLGYREDPLVAIFDFGESPPTITKVVGSFGQNNGSEIFLPERIKVFGGQSLDKMELLGSTQPDLADGYAPNLVTGIPVEIKASNYKFYKLEASPFSKLPKWHGAHESGRKTWVFLDEIFFY